MSESVEFRVGVINDGHPGYPLYLPCADAEEAERRRESWSNDPDPEAEVWIERRVIGAWERLDPSSPSPAPESGRLGPEAQ